MYLLIKNCLSLLALGMSVLNPLPLASQNTHVVRAAIDIGSGGPKLRIAEVDLATNKIVKILQIKQYPVIFQEYLSQNSNKTLSPEIMHQGIGAIKDAVALANSFAVEGIAVIGTSVFRNAVNGEQFAQNIRMETGLQVHVLDQDLEGKLAFQAALAKTSVDNENLVVWDIGGGSTQFIEMTIKDSFRILGSDEGSGPFRDFIIESIQKRNLTAYRSPNPLSFEHAKKAESHASSLSSKIDPDLRNKICKPTTTVIGVGSVFGRGIAPLLGKNLFKLEDLKIAVSQLIGKNDKELGGDFASIEVSNVLLVLGFMKGLDIDHMHIIDVNNADGALVYKPFWE